MASRKPCSRHKRYSTKCKDCQVSEYSVPAEIAEPFKAINDVTLTEKSAREEIETPTGFGVYAVSKKKLGFPPCRRDIECSVCR